MEKHNNMLSTTTYTNKVWVAVGITTFVIVMMLILYITFNTFLLLLTASLIALFFRILSNKIKLWTGWKDGICLSISIVLVMIIVGLFFWLVGNEATDQFKEIQKIVPQMLDNAKAHLNTSAIGQKVSDYVSNGENQKKVLPFLQGFFQSSFGIFGDLFVVLFLSMFLAVAPFDYVNGVINLVPRKGKPKAKELFGDLNLNLSKWIKGTIISCLFVFVFTAIGLLLLGVKMWLILAILAGLLNIIPYLGTIIAMIPAVLVALMISPTQALLVAILFLSVHGIVGFIITPNVHKKLLNIPPALLILIQVLMATLLGGWGIVLAVPILVIVITLVKDLYLDREMGELFEN
ncbi:MAG: AI-2E family transporter [Candidatus Saccharimonadaceae bacterium]